MSDQIDEEKAPVTNPLLIDSSSFTDNGGYVPLGSIGYKFRKYFPGYGYFTGEVVEIRPGADSGKDRRCLYCDGDVEDLSISELRNLYPLDASSGSQKSSLKSENVKLIENRTFDTDSKNIKNDHRLKRSKRKIYEVRKDDYDQSESFSMSKVVKRNENPFSSIDELVPIDTAAESTIDQEINIGNVRKSCNSTAMESCKSSDVDDDNELDIWLENIASLLGASNRSKQSTKVPSLSSDQTLESSSSFARFESDKTPTQQDNSKLNTVGKTDVQDEGHKKQSSSEDSIILLSDIPYGSRHGRKIFNIDEKNPVVGEVILESRTGWIEAIIKGSLIKARVSKFFVVPTKYNIGDSICIDEIFHESRHNDKLYPCIKSETSKGSRKGKKWKEINNGGKCSSLIKTQVCNQTKQQVLNHRPSRKCTNKISTEYLFYWCCDDCTMTNNYMVKYCSACETKRHPSCKISALLVIAETAIVAASTVEEAVQMIPEIHLPAIPRNVINNVFHILHKDSKSHIYSVDIKHDINSIFYWVCGYCTMKNCFRKMTCVACTQKKDSNSLYSALLKIASDVSSNARDSEEAKQILPIEHRLAIPDYVLDALVTCVATVGKSKNKRRCLRPKVPGTNFCCFHYDPQLLDSNVANKKSVENAGVENNHSFTNTLGKSIRDTKQEVADMYTMQIRISDFLKNRVNQIHINQLNWSIRSIEDAILAQNNVPFPLGMLVRRFFPGYGFHDGRIIQTKRKHVIDDENGIRPVLIYKVIYNDGDSEEMLHHEINSLRQIYDQCNVKATAPSQYQILIDASYEVQLQATVTVVENRLCSSLESGMESDTIKVIFSTIGKPMSKVNLELTKLQLIVVREREASDSNNFDNVLNKTLHCDQSLSHKRYFNTQHVDNCKKAPVLEWPLHTRQSSSDGRTQTDQMIDQSGFELIPGLWFNLKPKQVSSSDAHGGNKSLTSVTNCDSFYNGKESMRPGVPQTGWDPAGALNFVEWDPFRRVSCEVCDIDKDDHLILICDRCHRGYHMYCVRPVIVNVPTDEWLCTRCTPVEQNGKSYIDIVDEVQKNPRTICDFFRLPFDDPGEFCHLHKETLSLFLPSTHSSKRFAVLGTSKSRATVEIGSLYFTNKTNKNHWSLPLPLVEPSILTHSLATVMAAMKFCGMETYSEDLVYPVDGGIDEKMNDSSLERIEPLSQRNVDIFNQFKENLKNGAFPPLKLVYDDQLGFSVEALAVLPKHTLIAEYAGEVTTIERSGETSSDSLMVLLDTGSPDSSLLIDPTKAGNIARFLNGINNRSPFSRRKANVRTRRFSLDGQCRVVLFTAKRIEIGDKLYYDYNAGVEGKSAGEWAKAGFYDTSNFF